MEALSNFFNKVDSILIEYSEKEEYTSAIKKSDLYEKFSHNLNNNAIFQKANKFINDYLSDSDIPNNQIKELQEDLNIDIENFDFTNFIDAFRTDISIGTVSCIDISLQTSCSIELRQKLLSFNSQENRIYYARLFAHELDSRLYDAFDNLDYLAKKGYNIHFLEIDIINFLDSAIEYFAVFDIDLVELLKESSDFEQDFWLYDEYRDEKFTQNRLESSTIESDKEQSSYQYNEEKLTKIYSFCNGDIFKVSFEDFIYAVSHANLSQIYNSENVSKNKFIYSIYIIKNCVDSIDWYKKAANSIGLEPTACSKKNVPEAWKNRIKAIE